MAIDSLTLTALIGMASLTTALTLRTTAEDLQLLAPWVATVLWGVVALTASNVVVGVDSGTTVTTTMLPVVMTTAGLAGLTALYGAYYLVASPSEELERADLDLGGGRR